MAGEIIGTAIFSGSMYCPLFFIFTRNPQRCRRVAHTATWLCGSLFAPFGVNMSKNCFLLATYLRAAFIAFASVGPTLIVAALPLRCGARRCALSVVFEEVTP